MVSFHELQELFLLSHFHGYCNGEELLLVYEELSSKNPHFPYENCGRFSLEDVKDSECVAEFRFRKGDLLLPAIVLQIPDSFTCCQRSVASGMEALCILLRRLTYPCRYSDMLPRFGRPVSVLSMINNQVLDYAYDVYSHKIARWNHKILSPHVLQM